MNLIKRLALILLMSVSAEAHATAIWNATDRGPVQGTYRIPVDTSSSSGPGQISASELQSFIFVPGVAQGDIAYFNGTSWAILPPGSSGQVLTAQGPSANPIWSAVSGSGTVTTTGTPASGNLAFFSGGTSITSGNLSGDCTTSGTGAITCTKTGGVSFGSLATSSAALAANTNSVAHQWLSAYNSTTGAFTQSQPAFTDLSGNISVSQMNGGASASSSTFWRGDGTWATPASSGGTPGGSPGQIQYNNGGVFGGVTLTTAGNSGPATISGGTLNIPQYTNSTFQAAMAGETQLIIGGL